MGLEVVDSLPVKNSVMLLLKGSEMLRIGLAIGAFLSWTIPATQSLAAGVDFQRDIQPILAEHCTHCHGVDPKTRKGKLRLDTLEGALKGGSSGEPALVPGQPEKSEIYTRILSPDDDLVMPPSHEKKPLTAAQQKLIGQWISEGAKYEIHWAFAPPRKASLPAATSPSVIDAIVRARLKKEGLAPNPPSDKHTLCRRLYLDLIGLPPTPGELATFEKEGVEKTIQRLLKSERYGEKWARHWLDLARYSDTNGYEKDMPREMWSWRDWVVTALNEDMPYNQFIIEQVAGDLLPNPTQKQLLATGFLRNSMINEEGAIVPEQYRMFEMFDRIDCLGKAVLGMTAQCAQCHTHKFDPLTHREYFGMFAFLNNTYEAQSWVYTPAQLDTLHSLRQQIRQAESRIRQARPDWQKESARWAAEVKAKLLPWIPLEAIELGSISGLNHPTQERDKSLLMKGHASDDVFFIATPPLNGITGLQLEALTHGDLPHLGPGRNRNGMWTLKGIDVLIKKPDGKAWEKLKLTNASADFSGPDPKNSVANIIDDKDDTVWVSDRGIGRRNQPSVAVVQFAQPLNFPAGTQIKVAMRMGDMLGNIRISLTTAPNPKALPIDHAAILAIGTSVDQQTDDQRDAIFTAWAQSVSQREAILSSWWGQVPKVQALTREIDELYKQFPTASTTMLHLAERKPNDPRPTRLLNRGEWDQPTEVVSTTTPAALHSFPKEAPQNRLGFARWLVDPRSSLAARVVVNQTWQAIFGVGLVETSDDFGVRTAMPEYTDLLDWLAVDFMEHGWSRKHLIQTIVSTATYQQSSAAPKKLMERDPRNLLLARGPRFRVDAEVVRDIALGASGLLTNKLGGPSIYPPVPKNVLEYNYSYPSYWIETTGADRYRRSLYVFRKRSMPDPALSTLDSPNGDSACARRVRSNTPLAALTGWNEPIFVEAARALALRVLKEAPGNDEQRLDHAFLLCTSRRSTPAERIILMKMLADNRQQIADGWLNPRSITTGNADTLPALPPGISPQDAAAWTLTARVLLNLDETITKN